MRLNLCQQIQVVCIYSFLKGINLPFFENHIFYILVDVNILGFKIYGSVHLSTLLIQNEQ